MGIVIHAACCVLREIGLPAVSVRNPAPRSTPHAARLPGVLAAAFLLLTGTKAHAQAADRVFPPGGQRGTTVTLRFPGMEKEESASLLVDGEGLRALGPFLKGVGTVEIAPGAEAGMRQVRLVGAKSATSPRPFAVGTLPELLEVEPNDEREKAQRIEQLPVTLNGAIPKPGDTDCYRLSLKKGDLLVVESESRRLAGPVYLSLAVRDAAGRTVAVDVEDRKLDPVFTCRVPADGDYWLQLADVTSNMGNIDEGCQYRLHLTTGPWLDFVNPPSAERGTTTRGTFYGWNLGGKPGPGRVEMDITVPASAGETLAVGLPDAPNRVKLAVGSQETSEQEPNNTPAAAQALELPAALHGSFGARGDRDVFRFSARAKEVLRIDVEARELDSLADPEFQLLDVSGKVLQSVDDADRSRDPSLLWSVPTDGTYTLVLEDLAGGSRGGPSSYYHLSIGPAAAELRVSLAEPTLTVKAGAAAEWSVTVYQAYQPDDVTLRIEGLPKGLAAEPVVLKGSPKRAGSATVKVKVTAAPDAAPGFGAVRVTATTAGGTPLSTAGTWMRTGDGGVSLGSGSTPVLVVLVPAP